MKTRWVILLVVLLLVGLFVAYRANQPDARVEIIQPKTQTIRAYVDEQAVTELPNEYLIATPIAGWLQPIELREGDKVREDQIVARLDTDDLIDHVHQTEQQ